MSFFYKKKSEQAHHKPEGMFKFMAVTSVQGKIVVAFSNMNICKWDANLWDVVFSPSPPPPPLYFEAIALTAMPICFRHNMEETTNSGGMRFFQKLDERYRAYCMTSAVAANQCDNILPWKHL